MNPISLTYLFLGALTVGFLYPELDKRGRDNGTFLVLALVTAVIWPVFIGLYIRQKMDN